MDTRSTWYHVADAEFLELRKVGATLSERRFDLLHHPGELDSSTVVDLRDRQTAASAARVREDQLVATGWVRRIEADFPQLFRELATKHELFRRWATISLGQERLESIFLPWVSTPFTLPLPSQCGFDERGPGECLELSAQWPAVDRLLRIGPPAPPRLLARMPGPLRAVFATHSFLEVLDEDAGFEFHLPNAAGWFLRAGDTSWWLNGSQLLRQEMFEPQVPEERTVEALLRVQLLESLAAA